MPAYLSGPVARTGMGLTGMTPSTSFPSRKRMIVTTNVDELDGLGRAHPATASTRRARSPCGPMLCQPFISRPSSRSPLSNWAFTDLDAGRRLVEARR